MKDISEKRLSDYMAEQIADAGSYLEEFREAS